VVRVLFPYARARVGAFIQAHHGDAEVAADLALLAREQAADDAGGQDPPPWRASSESAVRYVEWLMDRDRKSTGLKSLQGRIWKEGYEKGELRGQVYPDVPPAFERWRRQDRGIAIFSSGSVLAQRLLFACTEAGDLTRWIDAYFDTTTGPKGASASYERIATALGRPARHILFVSDVPGELDAARLAGIRTALCARDGEPLAPTHAVIRTFEEVYP
jgi:enolase-phosphatase E1